MMCKLKGWMDKGEHYKVEMKGGNGKGGIMMCKFKVADEIREGGAL